MIKVKVTTPSTLVPVIRQTPGSKGIVDNYKFYIDSDVKNPDWWVVCDRMPKRDDAICPPENTILITNETEFVKEYGEKYLNQFNWVVTCQKNMRHPRKILTQQGYGSYLFLSRKKPEQSLEEYQAQFRTYDELRAMNEIPKTKLMSVVVSHKLHTPGAIKRNQFLRKIKEHFGDRLDAYSNREGVLGPDTKIAKLKWDAVAPYKYHLAIENSYVEHYWTDKLLDAYLAGSYPIYYGHPSVFNYFPKDALTLIDIDDVPGSIAIIEKAISENYYENRKRHIWEARKLALDKYNLFQTIADVITSLPSGTIPRRVKIRPEEKITMKIKKILVREIRKIPVVYPISKKIYRSYRTWRYGQKFDD